MMSGFGKMFDRGRRRHRFIGGDQLPGSFGISVHDYADPPIGIADVPSLGPIANVLAGKGGISLRGALPARSHNIEFQDISLWPAKTRRCG